MRPGRDWLRIRKLPSRSLLFDLGLALLLTPYLLITAALVNFPFEEPLWVYVVEGLAVAIRRVWTVAAAAMMFVVSGVAEVTNLEDLHDDLRIAGPLRR
ncbi:hypothetical protein [Allorhizocola rhizosphaerae]|uniref:hypothetical protein n=1 Tax=Allorhizocola rhizosphaerae TaxID=1872709 RepID=UPI000E3DD817|nr:hypothetical protein [Allorhizocola rhizosphaerae]